MQFVEGKIISRIYGHGREWCFSQIDFTDLGPRGTIDCALYRLERKGMIRRLTRGLYDYPRYSTFLGQLLGPDIEQAAQALSRKFKWHVVPNGPTALHILGVSTQVPAQYILISSGPNRSFDILGTQLELHHQKTQQTVFKYPESALIVQALQSLGMKRISLEIREAIRKRFDNKKWQRILLDTVSVSAWIHDQIKLMAKSNEKRRLGK